MSESLRSRVQALWQEHLAEDGPLGVSCEAFQERLCEILEPTPTDQREATLAKLVTRDLYLVMGCLARDRHAMRLFMRRYRTYVTHLSKQGTSTALAEDVELELMATLFIARPGGVARLHSYRGQGTLKGWLRVTTRRMTIDAIRRQRPTVEGDFDRLPSTEPSTEAHLMAREAVARLRPIFLQCVAELSDADRSLLLQYYRDGRVLREIGVDLGIDTSSVYRRLNAVRDKIFKQFRLRARQSLGLNEGDLRSLLGCLADDLNLDELLAIGLILFLPAP